MDSFRRPSLDGASISSSGLRRWRLGTVASRHSVVGPSDSASASFVDVAERQSTCVARQTAGNSCAHHSLVVWAAVRRNASTRMTLAEKRQCPLLSCREQFADHELMLKHLYSCPHMASGEYWCYDCDRKEHLADAGCRRCCLGHASKRKRALSMAKTFFGALGHHKPKTRDLADMDSTVDPQPPPSYESVVPPTPKEAELHSNEIYEADSVELAPPPPVVQELYQSDPFSSLFQAPCPPQPPLAPLPRPLSPMAFGQTQSHFHDSLPAWTPSPDAAQVVSGGPSLPTPAKPPERPVLQVTTRGLNQGQTHPSHRGHDLTPSSSIRSTSSAASHDISPMSIWSGAWSRGRGFESTLTSPADDSPDWTNLWPQNKHAESWPTGQTQEISLAGLAPENAVETAVDFLPPELAATEFFAELAADDLFSEPAATTVFPEATVDVPMLGCLFDEDLFAGNVDLLEPNMTFDDTVASILRSAEATLSTGDTEPSLDSQTDADTLLHEPDSAKSLANYARTLLRVHIQSSAEKLKNESCSLARQFCQMDTHSAANIGLETLVNILQGRPETCPVKLLCFVHVAYSFYYLVHGQSASSRSAQLFTQLAAYGGWLSRQDRQAYVQVAGLLWKPSHMADRESGDIERASSTSPGSKSSSSRKGKERADMVNMLQGDLLILAVQHFLDELEMTVLCETQRPGDQRACELCMEHLRQGGLSAGSGSSVTSAANSVTSTLAGHYTAVVGFDSVLRRVLDDFSSGPLATPRLLELHLVQAGKMMLPQSVDMDDYVLSVRNLVDPVYREEAAIARQRLHCLDMRLLMDLVVQDPTTGNDAPVSREQIESLSDQGTTMAAVARSLEVDTAAVPCFDGPADMCDVGDDISIPDIVVLPPSPGDGQPSPMFAQTTTGTLPTCAKAAPSAAAAPGLSDAVPASSCEICGYRPRGDPRWFGGSMAKHKKMQHGAGPPTIYSCPYPGCDRQYRSRKDNLRQHQLLKNHFVDGEDAGDGRRGKRQRSA